jgi:hypothetical protein
MASVKNYYFILGIPRDASSEEIAAAYDGAISSAPGDAGTSAMMGEITEAYECLRDPARRAGYDSILGSYTPRPQGSMTPWSSSPNPKLEMESYYQDMKNKRRRRARWKKFIGLMLLILIGGLGAIYKYSEYLAQRMMEESLRSSLRIDMFHVNKNTPPQAPAGDISTYTKPAAQPSIRTYQVKSGGVVTAGETVCRKSPSPDAPAITTMRKDAVFFTTKELRMFDGTVWYYAENSRASGWVLGSDVKTYAYSKAN